MTAIQPNSTIIIGRSALRYGGEDTYYWDNLNQQKTNIMYEQMGTWNQCSYQREKRNYVRVAGNAEDYDGCNYMMFRNINYDHQALEKWFYAFILDIEYINNETMEIHYEIDSVQTYYFDYHENNCFVERCHSLTDDIGDNILPENVNCGEFVHMGNNTLVSFKDKATIIIAPYGLIGSSTLFDGGYSGLKVFGFYNNTELSKIHDCVSHYTTQGNPEIVCGFTIPAYILDFYTRDTSTGATTYGRITGYKYNTDNKALLAMPAADPTETLNGYLPKNKKMYTYPYNYCTIHDGSGNDIIMRYEFCYQNTPNIELRVTVVPPSYIIIRPYNYKGATYEFTPGQQITITSFPMISYSYPAWLNWISRALVPTMLMTTGTTVGGSIASMALRPDPTYMGTNKQGINVFDVTNRNNYDIKTQAAADVAKGSIIGSILANGYTGSMESSTSKGNYTNNGSGLLTNNVGIYFSRTCVSRQYAKMIDDYFTMYGYAYRAILSNTSFRKRRSRFTYIKTINCTINGQIPGDAMIDICARYDKGIRFWADYNNMYNYEYDNTVLP